jgi:spermidine/putrescine-binding protein
MKKTIRKTLAFILMIALSAGLLTSCGSSSDGGSSKEATLNFFCWTEYMPQSLLDDFEKETGIHVNMTTYSSNEDMLAKVKSETEGTYDLVVPSDYMVEQMAGQGMLEEIELDKLSNLENIGEAYLNPSYDPGNKYSVPYQGGVAAIAVNTSKVDMDITGYGDLFDPSLKDSIVVLDDFRAVIGLTERSMGLSMNESDSDKLSEVEAKLLTLKDNIKLYDSDSPKSALISGDCTVGFCWSAEVALTMEENPDVKIVFPTEGAYLFMDNLCIPKGSKHYDAAIKFIDFILDAENSSKISEEFPYLNPNTKAIELLGEDFSGNPAKNPPQDVIAAGEYVSNLDTDTLAIYDDMWTKLKK